MRRRGELSRIRKSMKTDFDVLQQHISKSLTNYTSFKTTFIRKEKTDVFVPVLNTFLIKDIRDGNEGPYILGTMVQRTFGLQGEEADIPFQYRFNSTTADADHVAQRKVTHKTVKEPRDDDDDEEDEEETTEMKIPDYVLEGKNTNEDCEMPSSTSMITSSTSNYNNNRFNEEKISDNGFYEEKNNEKERSDDGSDLCMAVFTFNVKVPLDLSTEFDRFPCTALRATADIELTTRNDTTNKNLNFRPNLAFSKHDRRDNICLQEIKTPKMECGYGSRPSFNRSKALLSLLGLQTDDAEEHALARKMDKMGRYQLISPYPLVSYTTDGDDRCKRFQVSFFLVEEGMPKFMRITMPMLLIAALNTIQIWKEMINIVNNDTDDSNYLEISSVLALAAVFVLPSMARSRPVTNTILTWDEGYVLLVFVALVVSSFPPTLVPSVVPIFGCGMLWMSFLIPVLNALGYICLSREIQKERQHVISKGKNEEHKHPFLKDKTFAEWDKTLDMNRLASIDLRTKTNQPCWVHVTDRDNGKIEKKY